MYKSMYNDIRLMGVIIKVIVLYVLLFFVVFSCGCDLEIGSYDDHATTYPVEQPEPVVDRSVRVVPSSRVSQQFLWKPSSENDGRLVILLPSRFRGHVSRLSISGGFGTEVGRFAGDTHNGFRPHFRFSHHGSRYGSNITVNALLSNGQIVSWNIPNGASRNAF